MRKATFALATLALLVLSGTASAAPVRVNLEAHNQRSSGGTLSTLKWKACAPTLASNPCLSTTNAWTLANATGSTAVWTWDAATGVLAMTGTFQSTSFVGSNANGSPVISDKVTDMVIDTNANTTTGATYNCVEGTFLSSVGANGCLNTGTGDDFVNDSSALYNVGGAANCIQRTIGGDDTNTGNPRGLASTTSVGGCDPIDGAFDLWDIESDNTASGGQLVIRNNKAITLPGTNYLTFSFGTNAGDDGPFNVLQGVAQTLNVLTNDLNFAGDVTVTVSTPPAKGTATVQGVSPGPQGGIQIQYTAGGASTGADTFVYTISDGTTTDTATVTVNILAGGANDDTATTTRNSAAININVGTNDIGFTDPVTIAITSAPDQGGTATPPASGPLADAIISYTPAPTAQGTATYTETFIYQITGANSLVDTGTVTVTVNNTVPVAGDAGVPISTQGSAPASSPGTFNAGTFAGNSLGNAPSQVTFTQGTKGTVSGGGASSTVTYTPSATFFQGTDTFDYTITDSDPGTPEADTGTVTVTIADVSPTLADGTITTASGTASAPKALSFTAGNGSVAQHTLAVTTQALNGSCAVSGTSLIYTPNAAYTGGDSCVVTITDENGAGQGDTGTFTISVTGGSSGGGGGSGGLLPGGSGAADPLSLALLASLPLLGRLRARRRAAGNQ